MVVPLLQQHSVCTRKNAQVVTNLQQICSNAVPTTCHQDTFAVLVPTWLVTRIRSHCWFPSCSQVVNALLRSCWLNRLVTSCGSNNLLLFQQLVIRIRSHCWFPSCWQVVTKLLTQHLVTSCSNNLLLFQQLVIVQQFINLSTSCEWQPCRFLRVYLILSSFIKQPWINNNVMHEPWLCKACLTYESNMQDMKQSKMTQEDVRIDLRRKTLSRPTSSCGVVVTTLAFRAGKPGFNPWWDLHSSS
jgi:hypothetical protein